VTGPCAAGMLRASAEMHGTNAEVVDSTRPERLSSPESYAAESVILLPWAGEACPPRCSTKPGGPLVKNFCCMRHAFKTHHTGYPLSLATAVLSATVFTSQPKLPQQNQHYSRRQTPPRLVENISPSGSSTESPYSQYSCSTKDSSQAAMAAGGDGTQCTSEAAEAQEGSDLSTVGVGER
jgi:hypothetical protein